MDHTGEGAKNTQQLLTYYELDLGLNHVVRKYSESLEEHANFLISVKNRFNTKYRIDTSVLRNTFDI